MLLDEAYHKHDVRFQYPGHWEISEESGDDSTTVTVGDAGAFWSLTILRNRPRPEQVIEEATQAFRDEYEDVDEYTVGATLGTESAFAKNLEFVAFELVNTVSMRALQVGRKTLFSMAQVTDHERTQFEPIFAAIEASVSVTSNKLEEAFDEFFEDDDSEEE